jgi:hypothetical protein
VLPVPLAIFRIAEQIFPLSSPILRTTFLRGSVLVMGVLLTGLLIQKIGRQPVASLWPHHPKILQTHKS